MNFRMLSQMPLAEGLCTFGGDRKTRAIGLSGRVLSRE